MAKRTAKTHFSLQEAVEECTRRPSDESGAEESDAPSDLSVDSIAEPMYLEGGDIALDRLSDADWEPETLTESKRQRLEKDTSSEEDTSLEDEPHPPTPRRGAATRRSRGRGRGRGRGRARGRARGRGHSSEAWPSTLDSHEKWNDVEEEDITPPQPTFRPAHPPGPRLLSTTIYTAAQLFQLFFTGTVLQTILNNTNECGATHHSSPTAPWTDLTLQDMFAFMSLVIYCGIVKCSSFPDYWRRSRLYNLPFPKEVMTGKKFIRMTRALHLSSMVDDAANDQKRGTAAFDRLCKLKPLYREIREACKSSYHPYQEISIDERMVASKAHIHLKQYMKSKPVRWGYKLFVLADSKNGYTWDFFVYEGKSTCNSGHGLSYESVMELVDTKLLGIGYKLYVDNFYTSPTLFRDLLIKRIWACGTIRTNRIGFPKSRENALDSKSPRGSVRWIRKDSLVFVQWRDTRDVTMCSALHTAHGDDQVERRVKGADGRWEKRSIPIPPAVKDYNRCMGGVDLSDALIGYYKVLHKTKKWYKTFFYHFMDIAVVNAFILHQEMAKARREPPLNQKAFRETLALELAEAASSTTAGPPAPPLPPAAAAAATNHHRPEYISGHSTSGRQRCKECGQKTPVKCSSCLVALCFVPSRDCYKKWHIDHNM